jgi:hypothetical protein
MTIKFMRFRVCSWIFYKRNAVGERVGRMSWIRPPRFRKWLSYRICGNSWPPVEDWPTFRLGPSDEELVREVLSEPYSGY